MNEENKMASYDVYGNLLIGDTNTMPDFDLIHTFSAFATDYSASGRTLNISSDTFLETFYDRYIGQNENGVWVGKKALGKDTSNTYDVFQYEFRPRRYDRTILLTSAMHSYELPASFGLARWMQEYMTGTDDVFVWLREHVRIICIPIVNPWGFNQSPKRYGTVNGVNPNRNFDTLDNEWSDYPVYTDEWNQKGSAPWSEEETQILREWANDYAEDALFYIDCHTGLDCSRASYGDVWSYFLENNPNFTKIHRAINALKSHISETYSVTATEYNTLPAQTADPYMNGKFWTNTVGVPFMTIEQAQGNDTSYPTVPNNCPTAIIEYATQIHAYIIAQLK